MSIESDENGAGIADEGPSDEVAGLLANDSLNNANNRTSDPMGASQNAGLMLKTFEAMKKSGANVDSGRMGIEQDLEDLTIAALLNTGVMLTDVVEFPGMLKGNADGLRKFIHGSPTETALYLAALKNYAA